MKHTLLLGSYGRGNMGDDAFLLAALELFPGQKIYINSADDERIPAQAKKRITTILTSSRGDLIKKAKVFARVGTIVYGGGDLWVELYGDRFPRQSLYKMVILNLIARLSGKKVYYLGCGIGKLSGYSLLLARLSARLAQGVLVRDQRSAELLGTSHIKVAPDLTINLPYYSPKAERQIGGKQKFTIGISLLYFVPNPERNFPKLIAQLSKLIASLPPEQFRFVLLPMLRTNQTPHDDIWASKQLQASLPNHTIEIAVPKDVKDCIAILGKFDLVLGARLHANILATLSGTPCLGIAYRPKVAEFFRDNSLSVYCVDLNEPAELKKKLLYMCANYPAVKQQFLAASRQNLIQRVAYRQFVKKNLDSQDSTNRFWRLGGKKAVLASYVAIFAVFFLKIIHGVGQYWDWSFPLFQSQISSLFSKSAQSWTANQTGGPLNYSSDYFARFVISRIHWLQPELLLYGLIVCLFSIGAYGVYIMCRRHIRTSIAFLLGLVAFVNPVIFYNYTAGYLDYFISYAVFIYFIYFMLYKFQKNFKSAVVVGLLLALVGIQIQFFIIASLFLAIFFLCNRERWSWRFALIMGAVPLLISLVWLSNFIFGGASIAASGAIAGKGSFKDLTNANYLSIFNFSFSKATLISRFYNSLELLVYGVFFAVLAFLLARSERKNITDAVLLSFLLVMVFLGTGAFQSLSLGPLTILYPMLREVGHFAPLIVLSLVLLLSRFIRRDFLGWLCLGLILVSLALSFNKFLTYPQAVDFAALRGQLAPFEAFSKAHQDSEYRVLTYPFFDQYAIKSIPPLIQNNLPLRNSGHDSFAAFATGEFVKNAISPQDFQNSPQYKLLQSYDIDILQPYNVHYIYDLSGIYESYFDRYAPKSTYNNDLSLIKDDKQFFDKLLVNNPGKVRRVGDHILEITDYTARVSTAHNLFALSPSSPPDEATNTFVTHTLGVPFMYATAGNTPAYATQLTRLFDALGTQTSLDTAKQAAKQTVALPADHQTTLYANPNLLDAFYSLTSNTLIVYTKTEGNLTLNSQALFDDTKAGTTLLRTKLNTNQQYYLSLNGKATALQPTAEAKLGTVSGGEKLELLSTESANLIANPSFEQGAWQPQVNDCSAYDNQPKISMSLDPNDKSAGKQSLQLEAIKHDACTSTNFPLEGNKTYILSYDYQSPNGAIASFYINFNDSDNSPSKGSRATSDTGWHRSSMLITSPPNTTTGRMFIYALESDQQQNNTVRYDNFSLSPAQTIATTTIPVTELPYIKQALPSGMTASFDFEDKGYTYQNLIRNGSFESGPWRPQVADCRSYDNEPSISMSIDHRDKTDGRQSLQLQASHHDACTYTSVNVNEDTDYYLTFSYQGKAAQQAGYDVTFNDPKVSEQNEHLEVKGNGWQTFSTKLRVPKDATTLTLYLYAFEGNGRTKNIVHYDNARLIELPNLDNRYYLVSTPALSLQSPHQVTFTSIDATKKTIHIAGTSGPFLLALSETYHPQWRLELNNSHINGVLTDWLPTVHPDAIDPQNHFELSDYLNGWYVDPAKLCADDQNACKRQKDGSYTMELVAEFVPQRWFVVNRMISILTLAISGAYLLYHIRDRIEMIAPRRNRHANTRKKY